MTGKVFQFIRKSKNISQASVCGDFLSRTSLSKYENEKNSATFQTMNHLLNQIDMSFDEFLFIGNMYTRTDRQIILDKYFSLRDNISAEIILEIIQLSKEYLDGFEDPVIRDVAIILEALLALNQHSTILDINQQTKNSVLSVWQRLAKMDQWYLIELKLANSILFSLPRETAFHVGERIIRELEKYNDFNNSGELKLSIYTNLSTLYLQGDDKKECLKFSKLLLEEAQRKKRYDFVAVAFVRLGVATNQPESIEKGLNILHTIEDYELENYLQSEIEIST